MDNNYEEFSTTLQNFDKKAYYNKAPHNVINCINAVKKDMQKSTIVKS